MRRAEAQAWLEQTDESTAALRSESDKKWFNNAAQTFDNLLRAVKTDVAAGLRPIW